jgi:FkbM family methyltransferase
LVAAHFHTPEHPTKLRVQNWLRKFLTVHALRIEVTPGVVMELDDTDVVQREILEKGGYERETLKLFDRLIANARGFVDVGAHHGQYTLRAARALVGRGGRVFAFEPTPTNATALLRNAELSDLRNIDLCTIALSNTPGILRMVTQYATNTGGARLFSEADAPGSGIALRVPVLTFAEVISLIPAEAFDVMKIDVEGFEGRVLKSLFENSENRPRHILLEYAPRAFDYDTAGGLPLWLEDHGYRVRTIAGEKIVPGVVLPEDNLWAELQ